MVSIVSIGDSPYVEIEILHNRRMYRIPNHENQLKYMQKRNKLLH